MTAVIVIYRQAAWSLTILPGHWEQSCFTSINLCHPSPQLLDALSFLQIHHCRRRVCPVNLSFFISNRKFILPTPELDRGEKKYTLRRRSLLSIRRATGGLPCHSGFSPSFHAKPFSRNFFFFRLGILPFKTRILHRQSECSNSRRPRYTYSFFIHGLAEVLHHAVPPPPDRKDA